MCKPMKNRTTKFRSSLEAGFTLVEIAMVLVIVGLIMAPAIHMYHQYRVDKDWDTTEENIDIVDVEIGGFRSVFGRYPCPGSLTAVPGDATYGHELADCRTTAPAPGNCVNGICTYTNLVSGENVIVGAVPFKTLNLQETESYNSSLSRFTYAVTADLTSNTTFTNGGGGISVVDKNDSSKSLVTPDSRAHFVLISHGRNQAGAFTRNGVLASTCALGSLAEQENCDADAIFTSGEYDQNTFDDRITFFSPVTPSEWQTSEADLSAIALKNTDSLAIGANVSANLTAGDQAMVLSIGADTGTAKTATRFVSETLCDYNANTTNNIDCFTPELLAGSLTSTGPRLEAETNPENGISCYRPGAGQDNYMTGIANKDTMCDNEIFVGCPTGSYITSIDGSGNVICDLLPALPCRDETVTTTCGATRTAAATYSGGYSVTYTGECRTITDYDSSYFAANLAGLDEDQIEDFVDNLNTEPRTVIECGDSAANSQIRDAWLCTAGSWGSTPARAHEKNAPWNTYPSNVVSSSSPWPAETSYGGPDNNNNNYYHDCWCREDYRVVEQSCPSGLTGTRIRVQKHTCPQTNHQWTNVYTSDELCGCAPGTTQTTQTCNSYYNEVNSTSGTTGLAGNVTKTYDVTCVADTPTTSPTPSSIDTSSCYCPSKTTNVNRTFCSTGTTNSWTWPGGTENDVATLSTQDWICPGTTSGGLPDPGAWGPVTPYAPIPACSCDSTLTDIVVQSCPSGLEGTGITYKKEWDCSLNSGAGGWEPQEDWELIQNNCNGCTWQAPTGAPSREDFAYGEPKGASCTCGSSAAEFCHDFAGGGKYDVWNGCPCVVQN